MRCSSFARLIAAGIAAALFASPALAETPVATAIFKCQGGKSIDATFYANSVSLKLSDEVAVAADKAANRRAQKADDKVQGKALNKRLVEKYGRR